MTHSQTSTPAPAPQPGRRDPEGRRRAILHAASEIILERGPAALTHRGVAKQAGVSLGSTTQYFASIDELRDEALEQLSAEIDASLASLEPRLVGLAGNPEPAIAEIHDFLRDRRAVNADLALMIMGATDPSMRPLALRWIERLIDLLTPHIGRARATAIAVYLDGATMHAGLHDEPLPQHEIAAVIRSLITLPIPGDEAVADQPASAQPGDPG